MAKLSKHDKIDIYNS